eukprot:Awhi_evm1s9559
MQTKTKTKFQTKINEITDAVCFQSCSEIKPNASPEDKSDTSPKLLTKEVDVKVDVGDADDDCGDDDDDMDDGDDSDDDNNGDGDTDGDGDVVFTGDDKEDECSIFAFIRVYHVIPGITAARHKFLDNLVTLQRYERKKERKKSPKRSNQRYRN